MNRLIIRQIGQCSIPRYMILFSIVKSYASSKEEKTTEFKQHIVQIMYDYLTPSGI